MANAVTFKLNDREFQRTLRQYVRLSRRTIPDIVNTKAFYIARRAVRETPKADKLKIGKELSQMVYTFKATKKGAVRGFSKVRRYDSFGRSTEVPLVYLLIQARRRRQGKKGLYGSKMAEAVRRFIPSRQSTVAFLKSGWLPAIKQLSRFAKEKSGAAPPDSSVKQIGRDRGRAVPARDGFRVKAVIENAVGQGGGEEAHHSDALERYGAPALQRAIDAEEASMRQYIEQQLKKQAGACGIRTV
jgi:hypothetical protein